MTTKEKFDKTLLEKKKLIKTALLIWLSLMIIMVFMAYINPSFVTDGIVNRNRVISIITLLVWLSCPFGFLWYIHIRQTMKKDFVCPNCKKSLSYLVTDPNYTNKYFALELPEEFPPEIKLCPYCKFDFNIEVGNE